MMEPLVLIGGYNDGKRVILLPDCDHFDAIAEDSPLFPQASIAPGIFEYTETPKSRTATIERYVVERLRVGNHQEYDDIKFLRFQDLPMLDACKRIFERYPQQEGEE